MDLRVLPVAEHIEALQFVFVRVVNAGHLDSLHVVFLETKRKPNLELIWFKRHKIDYHKRLPVESLSLCWSFFGVRLRTFRLPELSHGFPDR